MSCVSHLRLPGPNSSSSGCSTAPVTLTEWRTITLHGTPYAADGVSYTVDDTTVSVTYIFHDLYLTLLNPGDVYTQVDSMRHLVVLTAGSYSNTRI